MSVAFERGYETGPNDLSIEVYDTGVPPSLVDPFSIQYSIYDKTSGIAILWGVDRNTPVQISTGRYYVAMTNPVDANIGDWEVKWYVKDTAVSAERTVSQPFNVVNPGVVTYGFLANLSPENQERVRRLRVMLRDNDPDKNYHFRPPNTSQKIQGYTERIDYVWTDEELFTYILCSLDMINASPPQTFWKIADSGIDDSLFREIPVAWNTLLLVGASIFAARALQTNWIVDEFDYSISGVSLAIEKSSKYAGLADSWGSMFEILLENANRTVKLLRGLAQRPYGAGAIFRTGYLFRASTMRILSW